MAQIDTFGEYSWRIRSSECNATGLATIPAILNLLQEAASLNAEELGFSKTNFSAAGENISWVLTRLKVRMTRYPRWEETVRIVTWPREGRKITAMRDFEIFGEDGERLGIATSEWMIIDLASRHICPIPEGVFSKANNVRPPVFGDEGFSKFRWDCKEVSGGLKFRAKRCDIDMNGHVNNVHYAEWCLETVPEKFAECRECEILFKSETLAGEEVLAEGVEIEPAVFLHRVSATGGGDHVVALTRW